MQIEEVVSVSSKGQIVIPKRVRQKFGIEPGKKLLVAKDDGKILLRTLEDPSPEEINKRVGKVIKDEGIDVSILVDEAISWARKEREGQSSFPHEHLCMVVPTGTKSPLLGSIGPQTS